MKNKVLISDDIAKVGIDILTEGKIPFDFKPGLSKEDLKKSIGDYEGIIIRSQTKLTAEILAQAKQLRLIVRAGIGVDNIDVTAATKSGIVVENTPGGNVVTTAEHALALLLSLCRDIPQATASVKGGLWERNKFVGVELYNKTLGIVGLGNIGRVVADRARAFKLKVVAYDPYLSKESAKKMDIELVTFEELLSRSDFITIHVPLNESTKNLFSHREFTKMKKGAYLVNCARGGIVDESALHKALVSGRLSGAALDVFAEEPPRDNPLLKLPNVICTPHLGAATDEAQWNVARDAAEQVVQFFQKGVIVNSINTPTLGEDLMAVLKPYLHLGEKLGVFQGQIVDPTHVTEVSIEYTGEIATYDIKPITFSILKGFLSQFLEKNVNYVNAPLLAQDRGIAVREIRSTQPTDYTSLVTVHVSQPNRQALVAGTIFRRNEPRIVRIDGFSLEAVPEGYVLFTRNLDRPKVIGHIGSVLGENKINIARMQLGLDKERGEALALINIDSPVDEATLEKLRSLPHMLFAKQLIL